MVDLYRMVQKYSKLSEALAKPVIVLKNSQLVVRCRHLLLVILPAKFKKFVG